MRSRIKNMAMGNKYFDTSLDLYRFKILIQKE